MDKKLVESFQQEEKHLRQIVKHDFSPVLLIFSSEMINVRYFSLKIA